MKKRKTYEVSVINKTSSKLLSDRTKFYTSDTALELVFKLKEVEYDFDSAELILLNDEDRSLTTRPVKKTAEGFTYELEDDIVEHYGTWSGQLKFTEGSEIYVSSPVGFRIHNDLYNERPPRMSEVNTWKNLRKIADSLISDIRNELELVAVKVSEIEGAESERQSAELIRVENEKQRNLTSVDEFVKLQNAIGRINYFSVRELNKIQPTNWVARAYVYNFKLEPNTKYTLSSNVPDQSGDSSKTNIFFNGNGTYVNGVWEGNSVTNTSDANGNLYVAIPTGRTYTQDILDGKKWVQLEKGTQATTYTKAPEDYTTVTKDDYYNHIKLMNERTQLDIREKANKKQEDWITPTLLNGWEQQSAYEDVGYYKDDFGSVHLRGTVRYGEPATYVFTMPPGYRPRKFVFYPVLLRASGNRIGSVYIDSKGGVYAYQTDDSISLDHISFRAER